MRTRTGDRWRSSGFAGRMMSVWPDFLIPPGNPHNARDLGPGTGHMLSTYIVDPDQPLVTLLG